MAKATLLLLSFALVGVNGWCWVSWRYPYFEGAPTVTQIDPETVNVSWSGVISLRECVDQFFVVHNGVHSGGGRRVYSELVQRTDNRDHMVVRGVKPRVRNEYLGCSPGRTGVCGAWGWPSPCGSSSPRGST